MSANSWHCSASCSSAWMRAAASLRRHRPAPRAAGRARRRRGRAASAVRGSRRASISAAAPLAASAATLAQARHGVAAAPAVVRRRPVPPQRAPPAAAAATPRRRCAAGRRGGRRMPARTRRAHHCTSSSVPATAAISAAAAASRCSNAADARKRRRRRVPGRVPAARSCAARPRRPAGARRSRRPADRPRAASSRTRSVSRRPPNSRGGSIARLGQLQQAPAEHQQMAGEVAAVDRRDVQRQQRLERARVVPVVEVAAVALHPASVPNVLLRAVEQAGRGAVAEIVGGQVRQQRHADVGRAGARAIDRGGMLLEIVRRQPVVLGR